MALTWREVTAPKLDTRDLAYAGQAIGASFDKLGDMFIKREENLRSEATDAAIARALANGDPNQKLDLTGLDKRVNAKELAIATNAHINGLIQREQQREEMLNKQALAQFGKYNTVRAKNILSGVDEFAGVSAEDLANPAWSRYLGQVDKSSLFDDRIDNVESERNNRAQNAASQTSAAASMMNARANVAKTNFEIAALQRQENERKRIEQTLGFAGRVGDWYAKNNWSAEDAVVEAKKGKAYQALKSESEREAYLGRLQETIQARQGLTSVDVDDGTQFSLKRFNDYTARAQNRVTRQVEDLTRNYTHNQPGLSIAMRAAGLKTVPTENSLRATFEKMENTPPFAQFMLKGIRDGRIDPRVAQVVLEDFSTGLLDGGGIRAESLMDLGTRMFLDRGNPGSAVDSLNQALSPLQARAQLLKELANKASRERANGMVRGKTWKQLASTLTAEEEERKQIDEIIERTTRRPRGVTLPATR